jgi:hypothetical protein
VRAPPEVLPPSAIVAERDWLIAQPSFKPERQPVLDRLCKATVWNQLSRRSPVIAWAQLIREWSDSHQGKAPDEKWSDRELALQEAFRAAFFFAISNIRTHTPAEERETVNFYREKAKQFQEEASFLVALSEEAAGHAHALAEWYEAITDELGSTVTPPNLFVSRHQKSPQVRAYCVLLGGRMRRLYGHVLREMVASIATAAFNQSVSKEDVGYWCK